MRTVSCGRRQLGVRFPAVADLLLGRYRASGRISMAGRLQQPFQIRAASIRLPPTMRRRNSWQKRLRMLNAAQHKSMVSDTDKLLKLADAN